MAASMFRGAITPIRLGHQIMIWESSNEDRRGPCHDRLGDISSSHDVCNLSNANIIYNDPICLDYSSLLYSGSKECNLALIQP